MAFIDTSETEDLSVFYNVHQAVGVNRAGYANQDSVMKVGGFGSDGGDVSPIYPGGSGSPGNRSTQPTPNFGEIPENPPIAQPPPPKKKYPQGFPCPNLRDDVMLVQYLLKSYYESGSPEYSPKGQMKVDGICGPITNNWILKFQLDCNRDNGEPVLLVDNQVDRVRNKSLYGGVSHKIYTLAVLNMNVKIYNYDAWVRTPLVVPVQNTAGVTVG